MSHDKTIKIPEYLLKCYIADKEWLKKTFKTSLHVRIHSLKGRVQQKTQNVHNIPQTPNIVHQPAHDELLLTSFCLQV